MLKEQYSELLALTQLFLLREYNVKTKTDCEPLHADFYTKLKSSSRPAIREKTAPTATPDLDLIQKNTSKPIINTPPPALIIQNQLPEKPEASVIRETIKSGIERRGWGLEPLGSAPQVSSSTEFKQLFSIHFSHYALSDTIPTDTLARRMTNDTDCAIAILTFEHSTLQQRLLENLARAISLQLAPARVFIGTQIEKEHGWDKWLANPSLKLILCTDEALYLQHTLMQHYLQSQHRTRHFLQRIPLLLLSDLSLYLNKPQLKPVLWRAICNEWRALQSK